MPRYSVSTSGPPQPKKRSVLWSTISFPDRPQPGHSGDLARRRLVRGIRARTARRILETETETETETGRSDFARSNAMAAAATVVSGLAVVTARRTCLPGMSTRPRPFQDHYLRGGWQTDRRCGALTPSLWPHLSHATQAFADHASQAAFQLASNVSWFAAARARCSPGSRSKRRLRLVREAQ